MKMIKFLVFVYLATFICASHDQEPHELKLNTSVQTLLETIRLADQNTTENTNFIWDLLDPIIRFLLLNQTQITSTSFNITEQILSESDGLNWASLPTIVQSILSEQGNYALINQTYFDWGWIEDDHQYSETTLSSLLSSSMNSETDTLELTNKLDIVVPIQYYFKISLSSLNETLEMKHITLTEFFDTLLEFFPGGLIFSLESLVNKRQEKQMDYDFTEKIAIMVEKIEKVVQFLNTTHINVTKMPSSKINSLFKIQRSRSNVSRAGQQLDTPFLSILVAFILLKIIN